MGIKKYLRKIVPYVFAVGLAISPKTNSDTKKKSVIKSYFVIEGHEMEGTATHITSENLEYIKNRAALGIFLYAKENAYKNKKTEEFLKREDVSFEKLLLFPEEEGLSLCLELNKSKWDCLINPDNNSSVWTQFGKLMHVKVGENEDRRKIKEALEQKIKIEKIKANEKKIEKEALEQKIKIEKIKANEQSTEKKVDKESTPKGLSSLISSGLIGSYDFKNETFFPGININYNHFDSTTIVGGGLELMLKEYSPEDSAELKKLNSGNILIRRRKLKKTMFGVNANLGYFFNNFIGVIASPGYGFAFDKGIDENNYSVKNRGEEFFNEFNENPYRLKHQFYFDLNVPVKIGTNIVITPSLGVQAQADLFYDSDASEGKYFYINSENILNSIEPRFGLAIGLAAKDK